MERVGYELQKLKSLQSRYLIPFSIAERANSNFFVHTGFDQVVTVSARDIYSKHV